MKLTAKNYAKILYLSTIDLPKEKLENVIKNFIKLLIKNNSLNLIEEIINEFKRYFEKEKGIVRLKIISAFSLDHQIVEKALTFLDIKKELANIELQVDKNLIGGLVLKFDDKILDISVRSQANKIKTLV